jgi:type I restriction enzyme, S subunit
MGEWLKTSIGEQATLQRGFDITRATQRDGQVPVVSSGGISSFHDEAMVRGPGVVLGRKGVVGSVFYICNDYWPHDTSLWVKDFHGNDERFVYYFFRSIVPTLKAMDVGSANPTLNRNHVHPIEIIWPRSKSEQVAIASVLGALDDKIELNRRMNETLEAMARAIFKDWFVDFGPTRAKMEGRAPYLAADVWSLFPNSLDDSGKPEGWTYKPLLDHARLISGGTPKTDVAEYWGGEIAWASAKDVSQCGDSFLVGTERTITDKGLSESSTRLIPQNATVVVARGATTGRFCLFGREMAMNQTCYALASKSEHHFWLNCAFASLVELLVHAAHGSVFDTITTNTVEGARVIIPETDLQGEFEAVAKPLFERMLANIEESQTLAATRDLLLPKLMSGEIRIKDAEKIAEEAA